MDWIPTVLQLLSNPTVVIGIIAIANIIMIWQLFGGNKMIQRIRGTQVDRDVTLTTLNGKLEKIMGNHLHELPEMANDIRNMQNVLVDISKEQVSQGNRLTSVETQVNLIVNGKLK